MKGLVKMLNEMVKQANHRSITTTSRNHSRGNVQKFPIVSVGQMFESYLRNKEKNSPNTAKVYRIHIEQFFYYMTGKEVSQLVHKDEDDSDILFTNIEITDYKNDLLDGNVPSYDKHGNPRFKKMCASTANTKISAVRSFYEYISGSIKEINLNVFNIDRAKGQTESSGYLSYEEAMQMSELAKSLDDGEEKSCLIELATYTSIRLSALLNLKTNKIIKKQDEWVVEVFDKGQKFDEKPIRDDLYQRLILLSERYDDGTIFDISKKRTFQRTVDQLAHTIGINDRHITFHSLKNVAINWIIETTGNIVEGAKQGNHKDINTTFKNYVNKQKNFKAMAGVQMGKEKDYSKLESLSTEQWLELIKKCPDSVQVAIMNKAKEMWAN
jgi:site-specific recombinase XerC